MSRRLEEWRLEDFLRALRLHKRLILGVTFLCGTAAGLYSAQSPDIYLATARVLIGTETPKVVEFREVSGTSSPWDRSFLQTEYQVISGYSVMSRVIEELNLSAFPPFSRSREPALTLQGMVKVEPVRATKLVDIQVAGTNPELIARIANTVADVYARFNLERRRSLTSGGAVWLKDEVDKMETRMRDSQLKLQDFREKHGNVDFVEQNQNSIFQRLQALNTSLNKTREDRIEAETKYREKHPELQELLTKEKELQFALFEQEQRVLEMSRLSIQYNTLLRETKSSEQIYNTLLTRFKELSVQEGLQGNNVQIVDPARIPYRPIGPPRTSQTVVGTFLGLLLGFALSISKEMLTRTIRTRQDFEQALEIPFLGHFPLVPDRLLAKHQGLVLLSEKKPATYAEALRSIRTTLEFLLPTGEPRVLLITSAVPEEGKSSVSANLAMAFRELGRKVLLVDMDLRRPSIHQIFKLSLEPGLSGYLQETVSEEDLIQTSTLVPDLPIVTAGSTPAQVGDLLNSARFRDLLQVWKQQYQYILLDSSPVLIAADAAILSTLVDGVLFLVWAGRTHSETAVAGKQRLVDVGAKIAGGVLNGARLELERGYQHYYSYRYYRSGNRWRA